MLISAPVTPGEMVGARFYYRKPGAQTGTLSRIYVFGRIDANGDGVPVLSSFESKGQNDVVFTAADSGWTGFRSARQRPGARRLGRPISSCW